MNGRVARWAWAKLWIPVALATISLILCSISTVALINEGEYLLAIWYDAYFPLGILNGLSILVDLWFT